MERVSEAFHEEAGDERVGRTGHLDPRSGHVLRLGGHAWFRILLPIPLSLDFRLFVISQSSQSTCPRPKWLQYCFSIPLRGRHVRQIAPRITFRVYANDYPRRGFCSSGIFSRFPPRLSDMHALSPWQRISSSFPPPLHLFLSFVLSRSSMELIFFFFSRLTYDLASSIFLFFFFSYFCVTSLILLMIYTFFHYLRYLCLFPSRFRYFLRSVMRYNLRKKKKKFTLERIFKVFIRWFINLSLRYWSYGDQFFPLARYENEHDNKF